MPSEGLELNAMKTLSQKPVPLWSGWAQTGYKEEMVIGKGAFGTVYKARDSQNPDTFVALKKVRISLDENGVPYTVLREIALLRQLDGFKHPNIVRFLDVCLGPVMAAEQSLYLVFELVETDLHKYLKQRRSTGLSPAKVKDIMFQVLCGVDFLHSQRIIHRDLKPQNILIAETGHVKLADFGLAKVFDSSQKLTNLVATLWYRPPEVLLRSAYGTPLDMWSVGCIFADVVRCKPLLPGASERDQLELIFDLLGTPPDEEWPSDSPILPIAFAPRPPKNLELLVRGLDPVGLSLLETMLIFDPKQRITAHDALRHPYFENQVIPEIEYPSNLSAPVSVSETSSSSSSTASSTSSARSDSSSSPSTSSPSVTVPSSKSKGFDKDSEDPGYTSFIRNLEGWSLKTKLTFGA